MQCLVAADFQYGYQDAKPPDPFCVSVCSTTPMCTAKSSRRNRPHLQTSSRSRVASTAEARLPKAINTQANENNPCMLLAPGAVKTEETTSIVEPQPPVDSNLPDTPTTPQKEQPTVQPSSGCSTPRSSCSDASLRAEVGSLS